MRLEVENLTIHRGGRLIVAGLDFALTAGDALILRGPNGAGKTTLLRAVAGLLPASGGRITLQPRELALEDHLVYAGHLDAIKQQLSVAENLRFWAGIQDGNAQEALSTAGLEPIADRPAGFCSAGQKRRLGLARLLVAERPIWLLDEPTVSLDAEAVGWFARLVRDHCRAGGMAIMATHIDPGVPDARELALSAPDRHTAPQADPFLKDQWG